MRKPASVKRRSRPGLKSATCANAGNSRTIAAATASASSHAGMAATRPGIARAGVARAASCINGLGISAAEGDWTAGAQRVGAAAVVELPPTGIRCPTWNGGGASYRRTLSDPFGMRNVAS